MPHPLVSVASDDVLPAAADVVVIGGGIIGVSAALFLAREGLSVAVVEKGRIAAEQSSRNWGWVRQQGRDRRELALIVKSLAIWDEFQATLGRDLGFRRTGLLSLTRERAEMERWQRWAVRGRAAGIAAVELSAYEAEATLPAHGQPWVGGLLTPTDGRAEPSVAAPAIAEAARQAGASLHQMTAARGLLVNGGRVAGVVTEHGTVATGAVLVAAGAWSSLFLRHHGIRLPQLTVRETVSRTTSALEILQGATLNAGLCLRRRLDRGYTLTPRSDASHDLVPDSFRFFFDFLPLWRQNLGSVRLSFGAEFRAAWKRDRVRPPTEVSAFEMRRINDPAPDRRVAAKVLAALRQERPELGEIAIAESWGGRIDATPDLVPVIDRPVEVAGLTVATGFSGHGFGIGPGAGRLAADLVTGASPLVDPAPFRLSRFGGGVPVFIDPDVI
ncbi:FAD-binding oxidoreductase [Pseudoxanthobacter sp.]|uniref:NAD(P)/FAD-dependent oxidoreductase n=1 Tax=Pseudoxanthobacter sp. TaxID=1925742 RepID=UPI002FE0D0CE